MQCYNGVMIFEYPLHIVVDTNILFEGLTKRGGVTGTIIDAWFYGMFQPYVTNALVYEYIDVLSRKLSQSRWLSIQSALRNLLRTTHFVHVHYSWRPASPDPGDDHVIDCAMNANAMVVTSNVRDFQLARYSLGLQVASPLEFIIMLGKQHQGEKNG